MNRNIKTRNSSETQTIQYFNSTKIIKVKENDCLDIPYILFIFTFLFKVNTKNTFAKINKINFKIFIKYPKIKIFLLLNKNYFLEKYNI